MKSKTFDKCLGARRQMQRSREINVTARPRVYLMCLPFFLMGALLLTAKPAVADNEQRALTVIELYTSHGCSSCPSADRLLGELIRENTELIALEFHVDYWNNLVHGNAGSFTDPFSNPAFSQRQREYNLASLAGRPGVYTPQAIVNGRFAAVGSNRKHIAKALSRPAEQSFAINISKAEASDQLTITIDGTDEQRNALAGVDILLARYLDKAVTDITGGENKDITLTNHHIVTDLRRLGEIEDSGDMMFTIDGPASSEGCVVLVQEDASTPIYAAVACP